VEETLKPLSAIYMVYFSTLADLPEEHREYINRILLS
jgi:hypothetical protein